MRQRNTTRKKVKHRKKHYIDTQKQTHNTRKTTKTRTNDNKKITNTYTNKNTAKA